MNPVSDHASSWFERLTSNSDSVQLLLVILLVVLVTAIVVTGRTIRAVARERTKREIAAYIAEGAMTPEQGDRLMKASPKDC
ncbi:MAG: hypothetical protein AMXMBFR58_19690 [Phycisphaerae bacterium]|nr:hypothetical protein [Phycisphaerales bacterium]MCK6478454.1 hypothetical protein [Phycisphaerales bacterium]